MDLCAAQLARGEIHRSGCDCFHPGSGCRRRGSLRLAEQLGRVAFLLMGDAKGRREAPRRGIPSMGTLGVLQAFVIPALSAVTAGRLGSHDQTTATDQKIT
jgi:hypothetical protein